jgi:AraC-like DNA-binding protein
MKDDCDMATDFVRKVDVGWTRPATAEAHIRAVEQVVAVMRERFSEPLLSRDLSCIAHMSPYHFDRVFAGVTGIPPRQFLAAVRFHAAKDLLLQTRRSITDICFDVGYNSLGTFTTCFSRYVGVSPGELRRLVGSDWPGPSATTVGSRGGRPRSFVEGCLTAPDSQPRMFFVGLFPEPVPQGQPVGCAFLSRPGAFRIDHIPDGRWHAMAAALPKSDESRALLLPEVHSMLVAKAEAPLVVEGGRPNGPINLSLRRVRSTDPPVLLSFLPLPAPV